MKHIFFLLNANFEKVHPPRRKELCKHNVSDYHVTKKMHMKVPGYLSPLPLTPHRFSLKKTHSICSGWGVWNEKNVNIKGALQGWGPHDRTQEPRPRPGLLAYSVSYMMRACATW